MSISEPTAIPNIIQYLRWVFYIACDFSNVNVSIIDSFNAKIKIPYKNVYHLPCTPQSHPYYSKSVYTIDLDREQLFRKGKIG